MKWHAVGPHMRIARGRDLPSGGASVTLRLYSRPDARLGDFTTEYTLDVASWERAVEFIRAQAVDSHLQLARDWGLDAVLDPA